MHFRGAGPDVVSNGKAAPPAFGSNRPGEGLKQRLRVGVGNWEHWDFGDSGGFFDFEALGVFRGADSGSERITGIIGHVSDAAALHAVGRAIRSGGESFSLYEAIFVRVGINNAADGAMLGGDFGLDAAP